MNEAQYSDKPLIVDILTRSFDSNKSVNYVVKQDKNRIKRIKALMDYSFEVCREFGKVYLSDDKKCAALVLYPHKKKTTLNSIRQDLKLALFSIGISRVLKVLDREAKIKKFYPKELMYFWFLGVDPDCQGQGTGSKMLKEIIDVANNSKLPVYLETSTERNLSLYKKFNFEIFNQLNVGYTLYMFKKEPEVY